MVTTSDENLNRKQINKGLTYKMAYRPPTLLERLALRVLYDLATKVPKVILQRVDEVVPALKIQITEKANGCLGTEMIKRTSSKDKHYIKNVDIILSNEETEVVTVPQPDTFSKIKDVSQSSNVAATEIITALQLSHTNMDGAPNNIQAADIITEKLKLSNLYNNIVPSDVGVTEIMTEELQLSQANLHIWPAGNKDKSEIAGDHDYEYSQDIGERNLGQANGHKQYCKTHANPDSSSINQQDNTEAVLLVDPVTGKLSRSVNEVCLPNVNAKELLKDERTGKEHDHAANTNTSMQIKEEINKEFQDNNYSENLTNIVIKKEAEENIFIEHAPCQNNVDVKVKCEVKDEIMIEEHEIYVEDVQIRHSKDPGDYGVQTTDITQIKKKVDKDVSIQQQDVKKVYIKRIKDEVMRYTIADPESMEESSLVTKNCAIDSVLTAAPVKYCKQMSDLSYNYSEILKTSNELVNLPLVSSKQTSLKRNKETTSSMPLHTSFLCQAEHVYACNLCSTSFSNASTLKLHYEIHSRERAQKCNVCSKIFHDAYKLKMHIKIHTDFSSDLYADGNKCTRIFKEEQTLNCSGTFNRPSSLKMHSRYHAGDGLYRCRWCYKSFTNRNVLQMHATIHTRNRPHRCVLCSKTFIHEYQFTQHLCLHCEEKTHVCRVCNKCFSNITALRLHNRIHTEGRTFLCKKGFVQGSTHLLQVPTQVCQVCNRVFTSSKSLKIHNWVHIREKNFKWKSNVLNHRTVCA